MPDRLHNVRLCHVPDRGRIDGSWRIRLERNGSSLMDHGAVWSAVDRGSPCASMAQICYKPLESLRSCGTHWAIVG